MMAHHPPIFEPPGAHTASFWLRSAGGLSTRHKSQSVDGDAPATLTHANKRVEKPRVTSDKDSRKSKKARKCALCRSILCSKCTTIAALDPQESPNAPEDDAESSRPVKPRFDIAKRPRTANICLACAAKRHPEKLKERQNPASHCQHENHRHHREHYHRQHSQEHGNHRSREHGRHNSPEDDQHRSHKHGHPRSCEDDRPRSRKDGQHRSHEYRRHRSHDGDHYDRHGPSRLSKSEDHSGLSSGSEDAREYFSNHRWPKERVAWGHPKRSSSPRHRSATTLSKGSDSSSHRSRERRDHDGDSGHGQFYGQSEKNAPTSPASTDGISRPADKPLHFFDLTTRSSEADASARIRRFNAAQRGAAPSRQEAEEDLERQRRRSARNMELLMRMRDHYSQRVSLSLPSSPALPMPREMHRASRMLKPSALLKRSPLSPTAPLSPMSPSSPAQQQHFQRSASMPFLQPVPYSKDNPLDLGYLNAYKDAN